VEGPKLGLYLAHCERKLGLASLSAWENELPARDYRVHKKKLRDGGGGEETPETEDQKKKKKKKIEGLGPSISTPGGGRVGFGVDRANLWRGGGEGKRRQNGGGFCQALFHLQKI